MTTVYPGLQYLDGFPQIKVVLRADVLGDSYDKVAVISGGGSGHEPAHAGFVGAGMLTAAICGDVFTPPLADSVLAGIRAVTGSKGCLLIVQNYADYRHNFGLAVEKAKSEGYIVEMVIVEDDCAFPPLCGMVSRRGLAGTILVHKIAGAAAESGMLLSDVAAEANRALKMVGTIGVALSACTLPGQVMSDRIGPGFMVLGVGIHGEPGATVTELQPVDAVVSHVINQILSEEHHDWTDVGRYMDDFVFLLILDKLPLPELLREASVCKSWRAAQRMHRKLYASSQLYTGRRFPVLVFSRDPAVPEAEKLIYDPMRKSYYAIPLPDPDLLFCGAMLGWIFLIR